MKDVKRVKVRVFCTSIGLAGALLLLSGWGLADKTVKASAQYAQKAELETVRNDLAKIDSYVSEGIYGSASVIVGRDIKARDIYRSYLDKAGELSQKLVEVRRKLDLPEKNLSLQELGALTQQLSLQNLHFKDRFAHGEEHFQTYGLIQKAIRNLEDAIHYWRISNHYRSVSRGSMRERLEDDEILQMKLQAAMNAIDELKVITETRQALSRDLAED